MDVPIMETEWCRLTFAKSSIRQSKSTNETRIWFFEGSAVRWCRRTGWNLAAYKLHKQTLVGDALVS